METSTKSWYLINNVYFLTNILQNIDCLLDSLKNKGLYKIKITTKDLTRRREEANNYLLFE